MVTFALPSFPTFKVFLTEVKNLSPFFLGISVRYSTVLPANIGRSRVRVRGLSVAFSPPTNHLPLLFWAVLPLAEEALRATTAYRVG